MQQSGVTLIESLVALLLISIVLLGIAGLQLVTLQDSRDARWRIEGVSLANDVLERMRARPDDLADFVVDSADSTPSCSGVDASGCHSVTAWLAEVQRILPNAHTKIDVLSDGEIDKVTVSLRWRQQPPNDNDPLPVCGMAAASGGCVMLEAHL